ncbi:hypothetical protein [Mucilaginibacter myungsuensis]|uniref:Uncharacterized protein n=1 Tax=Mucilaginibacter myungsuensis TaxID=649104 RepID=A0A929KX30_9SPHI|nr:hypothetical protein [Mucilaginibacter myungsuensis]MBE9662050.1 hypothetical protein [Mucilaginibacter myungsuensis]MDN3599517.1 hypothetical protein [Mucilaginibacter myungsuensis]
MPSVQIQAVRAPSDYKVDGKTTEWNDQLLAYNKATAIFYTIANNDSCLYLAIKATDVDIINKIIKGGLTLRVSASGHKNDKNGVAITFPLFNRSAGFNVNLKNKPKQGSDTAHYKLSLDSFKRVCNFELDRTVKEIKVKNIKGITDSLISVYNDIGIKAKALFDEQIDLVCELAIPFKYLGLSMKERSKFSYNVKLNPPHIGQIPADIRSGLTSMSLVNGSFVYEGSSADKVQYLMSATDFWGEYTLAK